MNMAFTYEMIEIIFKGFLVVYMAVNCYTDFKWLITKNVWHLAFLFIVAIYSLVANTTPDMLMMMMIGFGFAYVLSKIPGTTLGAGDFKMLAAISSFVGALYGMSFSKLGVLILIYFVSDFLIGGTLYLINKLFKKEIHLGTYRVERGYIEMPQAIPLFIGCVITII